MKKIIVTFFILAMVAVEASSYPIDPRPLRKLVSESGYIVVGHVVEIVSVKTRKENWGPNEAARIRVVEVLQGKIQDEIIEVEYISTMICPAPPRYYADALMLVFLDKGENGKYRTHALSYGAKALPASAIAVYKARIGEIQKINQITDPDSKFMETIEWLVKCAEQKATGWEGIFELSPESDFMSYYSRSDAPPFRYLLSEDQKQRLKRALLETSEPSYSDLGLVDLLYASNEEEVRSFLLNGLKNIKENQLWIADAYMIRWLYGKESTAMEKLLKEFQENMFESNSDAKLKKIVSEFVALAEK